MFRPRNRCGIPPIPDSALRGITLEDQEYLEYCKRLHINGFEICLHGASAGNNTRTYTLDALDFLERNIGGSDTFVCHSKNADNIYWEDKVTSLYPFKLLLKAYSKYSCSGEVESSPFFWGDICYKRINQIRLFRTRRIDTLNRNPSMPYFHSHKPYVNAWFSATKRRLADCACQRSLDSLKSNNGLTVLYQYLHRYVNPDSMELDQQFVSSIENIIVI